MNFAMTKDRYKNREIDNFHHNLKGDVQELAAQMKKGFEGVHKRQDITNGRINQLEGWKKFMQGGLAVLSAIMVPIIIYIVTKGL